MFKKKNRRRKEEDENARREIISMVRNILFLHAKRVFYIPRGSGYLVNA